jgi:hypothetical protein
MIAEYLDHALNFERMASETDDQDFKVTLLQQAQAYRRLAEERAALLHVPLPSESEPRLD